MAEAGWLGHAVSVGRTEFRRTLRSVTEDRVRLALIGFGVLLFGAAVLFFSYLILQAGDAVIGAELSDVLRGTLALQWLFAVFIFTQRAVQRYDRVDAGALMLTTVSVRTMLAGTLLAEFLRALTYIGGPLVVLASAFAYAVGSPLTLPMALLAGGLFLATAMVVGYVLGLTGALLVARYRFLARNKTVLGGAFVLGAIGLYTVLQSFAGSAGFAVLGILPFAWFLDLGLVAAPVVVSVPKAAAVAVGGAVWVLGLGALSTSLAGRVWLGDSVEPEVADEQARVDREAGEDPLDAALAPFPVPRWFGLPATRIAQRTLLVTRRNPSRLSFLLVPVIVLGSVLVNVGREGGLTSVLPLLFAVFLPWVSGAAAGLNPLGDEGSVLPATLTSLADGRQYVRGLMLPGLFVGVPLAVLTTGVAAAFSPFEPLPLVALVVLAGLLAALTAAVAPAIGITFPRFDPVRVSSEREVVPPSLSAVVLYTLFVAFTGGIAAAAVLAPGLTRGLTATLFGFGFGGLFDWLAAQGLPTAGLASAFADLGATVAGIDLQTLRWGGYTGPLALGCLVAMGSLRYVRARYERYRPD